MSTQTTISTRDPLQITGKVFAIKKSQCQHTDYNLIKFTEIATLHLHLVPWLLVIRSKTKKNVMKGNLWEWM